MLPPIYRTSSSVQYPDLAWDPSLFGLTVLAEFVQVVPTSGGPNWATATQPGPVPKDAQITGPAGELDELAKLAEYRAEVLSEGGDVSLLTYGFMLREAERARQHLEAQGVRVRLVNLRTLRPIDVRAVLRAATESKLVVTIEDHSLVGGLYSMVCEVLVANEVRARVLPIALESGWFKPAMLKDVLAFERFDGASIAARVIGALRA